MKVVVCGRCVVPILSMRLKNVPESMITLFFFFGAGAGTRGHTRSHGCLSALTLLLRKTGTIETEKVTLHVGKTDGSEGPADDWTKI